MLSQYSRALDAAVRVSQYRVTVSRIRSSLTPGPAGSAHSPYFSAIQAARPTGESVSA
jgi:hypothetical protein